VATLIVVRRDAGGTYRHFLTTLARVSRRDVELMWDRRVGDRRHGDAVIPVERRIGERRAADSESEPVFLDEPRRMERRQHSECRVPDRRQGERRQRLPDTWRTLGFVLVPRISHEGPGEVVH
jgi:hypothetical protein